MDDEQATEAIDKKEVDTQTHLLIEKVKERKELSKEAVAMLLDDDTDRY
jgi:hypothetical protein